MENMHNDDYLNQYAGMGTEDLRGGTPFLSITQRVTTEGAEAGKVLGDFWHSGLGKTLGKTIKVVPLQWKPIWVEKSDEGQTIRYHAPNSIRIKETGSGDTYKCINPESGNKIERTILVPLMLPNHEDSLCVYIPNVTSMSTMKEWRSSLNINRLSNGQQAPIFSHIWELTSKVQKKGKNEYFVLETAKKGERCPQHLIEDNIVPMLAIAAEPMKMLPMISDSSYVKTEEPEVVETSEF